MAEAATGYWWVNWIAGWLADWLLWLSGAAFVLDWVGVLRALVLWIVVKVVVKERVD